MDSTLEAGKGSGGSEQKSVGGSAGKDGSTREEQQQKEEEEGGSEAVPVDLKQTEDNKKGHWYDGFVSFSDYFADRIIEESPPHEKPWYHTSCDEENSDSDWIGTFNFESDSDVDYDSDSVEGRRQRRRHMRRGDGLSYALRIDDARAFMYLTRKLSGDEKSEFIFKALHLEKFCVAKALMEDETTDMTINTRYGSNPLHMACNMGNEPLAHLVVSLAQRKGVLKRMIVANSYGRTPLLIAQSRGMDSLCERVKKILSEDKAAGSSTTNADANLSEDNVAGSSTKNTQAKLSDDNTAGSPTKNAEANLSEDTTAGSSTKNAEANPSKKQKTQV